MDGLKRIARILIAPLAWCWRRFPRATALILALYVVYEFYPSFPRCNDSVNITGTMSPEYRAEYTGHLDYYGVYYWDIGGVIFTPLYWLLSKDAHPSAFVNAEIFSSRNLLSDRQEGEIIAGKPYHVPDWMKMIRSTMVNPGTLDYRQCYIMPYVVTGKPPEGLYAGKWKPPTKSSSIRNIPRDVWEKYAPGHPYPY